MNTEESIEFVKQREVQAAATPSKETAREIGRIGVCMCCGAVKRIRPAMHVCWDCFSDARTQGV